MFISQISVFAENRPGALAEITGLLADAKIDLRAFYIADTADFGILRMIVGEPDRAAAVLREHNIANSINFNVSIPVSVCMNGVVIARLLEASFNTTSFIGRRDRNGF